MKKLMTITLILALLLPAVCLAETNQVDEYYGYAHMEVAKDGSPFMSVIYFAPDQNCYFLTQMFWHDEPGLGRAYVGTWGYTADGLVFAKTGENTSKTFKVTSLGSVVDTETMEVYISFDALMK